VADEEKQPNLQALLKITPGEDFSEDYANTFTFEQTAWDFKIIFGQTDQMSGNPNDINWHTSMTMPWGIAKILSHMLILNITAFELSFGQIQILPSVMPPEPVEPTGDLDNPATQILYRMQRQLHRSLVGTGDPKNPLIPVPEFPE
jgi:hypothetical protein